MHGAFGVRAAVDLQMYPCPAEATFSGSSATGQGPRTTDAASLSLPTSSVDERLGFRKS